MTRFELLTLILVTYLLVCFQISFEGIGFWMQGYIHFPTLVIAYSVSTGRREIGFGLCFILGLWLDSLSMTPLGISILALLATRVVAEKVWRNWSGDPYLGLFAPGFAVGILYPLFAVLLMSVLGESPLTGWRFMISLVMSGLTMGLLSPIFFRVLNGLLNTLNFKPISAMRANELREIRRG